MAEKYNTEILKVVIAQICTTIGYTSIQNTPLELLVDIFSKYLKEVATTANRYAELYNRTSPNLDDLALTFGDMNINLNELEEYIHNVASTPCAIDVPKFPIPRESHLNFLKPGSNEILSRPVHIHEHLPPIRFLPAEDEANEFPENDTESDMIDNNFVNNNIVNIENEVKPVIDLEQTPQSLPMPFKKSGELFNNANANFSENVKRFLIENEMRPTHEITSVMMTTSGFISPAREGKIPDLKIPIVVEDNIRVQPLAAPSNQFNASSSIPATSALVSPKLEPALHANPNSFPENIQGNPEGNKMEKIKKKKLHDKERKKMKNPKSMWKGISDKKALHPEFEGMHGKRDAMFDPANASKKNRMLNLSGKYNLIKNMKSKGGIERIPRKGKNKLTNKQKQQLQQTDGENWDKLLPHSMRMGKNNHMLPMDQQLPNPKLELHNNPLDSSMQLMNSMSNQASNSSYNLSAVQGSPKLSYGNEKISTTPDRQKLNIFKKITSTSGNAAGSATSNKDPSKNNDDVMIISPEEPVVINVEDSGVVKKRGRTPKASKQHASGDLNELKLFQNNNIQGAHNYDDIFSTPNHKKHNDSVNSLPRTPDIVMNPNSNNFSVSDCEDIRASPPIVQLESTSDSAPVKEKKKRTKKDKEKKKQQRLLDTKEPILMPEVLDPVPSIDSISPFLLGNNSAAAALGLRPPPRVGIMDFNTFHRFPSLQNFGPAHHNMHDDKSYTMSTYKPVLDSAIFADPSAQSSNPYEAADRKSHRYQDSEVDLKSLYDKSHCNVAPLIPPSLVLEDTLPNIDKQLQFNANSVSTKSALKQETKTKTRKSSLKNSAGGNPSTSASDSNVNDANYFANLVKEVKFQNSINVHEQDPQNRNTFNEDNENIAFTEPSKRTLPATPGAFLDRANGRSVKTFANDDLHSQEIIDVDMEDDINPQNVDDHKKKSKKKEKDLTKSKKKKDKKKKYEGDEERAIEKKIKKEKKLKEVKLSKKEKKERKKEKERAAAAELAVSSPSQSVYSEGNSSYMQASAIPSSTLSRAQLKTPPRANFQSSTSPVRANAPRLASPARSAPVRGTTPVRSNPQRAASPVRGNIARPISPELSSPVQAVSTARGQRGASPARAAAGANPSRSRLKSPPSQAVPIKPTTRRNSTLSNSSIKNDNTDSNQYAVPKITLKLSPRPNTPDGLRKITIKPVRKNSTSDQTSETVQRATREATPELAKISALVTRPPKQNKSIPKTEEAIEKDNSAVQGYKNTPKTEVPDALASASATNTGLTDEDGNEVWICPACAHVDDGTPMIGCDGCDAWYHWVCVGIQVPPDANEDWYCRVCINKKQASQNTDKKKKRKKKDRKDN